MAKAMSKDDNERVIAQMLREGYLAFDFGTTAYAVNAYLKATPRASLLLQGAAVPFLDSWEWCGMSEAYRTCCWCLTTYRDLIRAVHAAKLRRLACNALHCVDVSGTIAGEDGRPAYPDALFCMRVPAGCVMQGSSRCGWRRCASRHACQQRPLPALPQQKAKAAGSERRAAAARQLPGRRKQQGSWRLPAGRLRPAQPRCSPAQRELCLRCCWTAATMTGTLHDITPWSQLFSYCYISSSSHGTVK